MPLKSLIQSGTKLWLDSVDPNQVQKNADRGATGATSNPIIIADILKTGAFDDHIARLIDRGMDDAAIAWEMTDELVADAQEIFLPVWEQTNGNDGYVSFELDPLLEDPQLAPPMQERVRRYVELGKHYALEQDNRMIKVPATEAGLAALEDLAAEGITLNVTLIFSQRQYIAARDAVWRGVQRSQRGMDHLKSVYSIFVSRVDVYTDKHVRDLSDDAQGVVGVLNAKELWRANQEFWRDKNLPLQQEIIFASTGKKLDWQAEDYYVEQLAGSDIMTNPPETNDAIERLGKHYERKVDQFPPEQVVEEIHQKVDVAEMEAKLMAEGVAKFADPFKKLLATIAEKRQSLTPAK
jgi:transaldolase